MKNTKQVTEKALDNKCPSCGAPIKFNPTVGKWKCEYCDSEFSLEEMQKYNNASNDKNNENSSEGDVEEVDTTEYVSYKCQNCGAEIVADEHTAATFCVYCGNTAILKNKLSGEFKPNLIIPFKTDKSQAIKSFENISKGRPFVPKGFNNKENIEKIKGIYIPFWLYDVGVSGDVEYDAKKVTSWSRGNTHYTKTDIYKIFRAGSMKFSKIPVDGSTRFDNNIMNSIEPFNYDELIKYNHAYLSGFFAEKYDVDSDEAFKDAQTRALESGKEVMVDDSIGYSGKLVTNNTLSTTIDSKYYVLLPVWMVNVKYKDKMYIFAMNGQTGEFIGDIPLDKNKAILWGILMFIGMAILVILISILVFYS